MFPGEATARYADDNYPVAQAGPIPILFLVDKADRLSERFIVTKNGTPKAVVLGMEEFESWVETLELLSNPKAVKSLEQGLKEAKARKLRSFKDVFGAEQRRTKALKPLKGLLKGDNRPWPYR